MRSRSIAALSLTLLVTGLTAPAFVQTAAAQAGEAGSHTRQVSFSGENSTFGASLAADGCDINGDKIADTIVGDQNWNRPPHEKVGAAYVIFGSRTAVGGDVTDPASAGAVRIDGPAKTVPGGTWAGSSVACLGDVNGDGFEDIAVGAGSRPHHEVAVLFGAADFGPADLDDLGARGYLITDPGAVSTTAYDKSTDNFGFSVGAAGDVDRDGLADIVISDNLADYNHEVTTDGGTKNTWNAGRAWVVKGKKSTAPVDVQIDTDQVIMTIDGTPGARLAGARSAGDVNGDGKSDIVIGAYTATPWGSSAPVAGSAHIVFGGVVRDVVLGTPQAPGFDVFGPQRGRDRLGMSVSPLGDINDDGLADFVAGADGVSTATAARSGGAAVVWGSLSDSTVQVDPAGGALTVFECADGSVTQDCAGSTKIARGHWINGAADDSKAGFSAAGTPDVNSDGTPDLLIGAYGEAPRGAAYLLHLDGERTQALDLAALTNAQGQRTVPTAATGAYGRTVASVGDFDANGAPDFLYGGNGNALAMVLRGDALTTTSVSRPDALGAGDPFTMDVDVATVLSQFDHEVTGSVSVTLDGQPMTGAQQVALDSGKAVITMPALGHGAHAAVVTFTPGAGSNLKRSTAEVALEVGARASAGRLALDAARVTAGSAVRAVFSTDQALSGEVTFTVDGVDAGRATIVNGQASIDLAGLAVGDRAVRASYRGDTNWAASQTDPVVVTVAKGDVAAVTPAVSRTSIVRGSGTVTTSVQVPGGQGGEVSFHVNGREIGRTTVDAEGNATLRIPTLDAGRHTITARFHGTSTLNATEVGKAQTLTVAKASLGKLKVKGAAFAKGKRPKVTVALGKLNNGAHPTGTVKLKSGAKTYTVKVTKRSKGKVVFRLKKATKAVKVRATFTPTDARNVASATSAKVTVRVRR